MPMLVSFLNLVFSRITLLLCGFLLLGITVWFGGPLVALDGVQPLASVSVRLVVLALLLATALLLLTGGPFGLVVVVGLCLCIWQAGPLLSLGSMQPLVSREARILCMVGLLLLYAGYWLHRLLDKVSEDPEFLNRFFRFRKTDDDGGVRKRALVQIELKLRRALARLRAMGEGGLWRRWFENRRHLYALPWFMVIGPTGAGKTALLRKCGLQFPLTRDSGNPVQDTLPTEDCDWWLSNQAVMLDTSGRYVQAGQSSPTEEPDLVQLQWQGLLGLLCKHRPRAPINGVLMVVSVAELVEADASVRSRQAGVLRERLAELRRALGITFPVYLVVSKVDQMRGFREFFQSLTSEGRTQVWGFTFTAPKSGMPWRNPAMQEGHVHTLKRQVGEQLDQLKQRLEAGLRIRLNEEFALDRRQQLFTLPLEMEGLNESVARLVDEVFLDSRFDETPDPHTLRGVYFCSAEQGDTRMAMETGSVLQQLAGLTRPRGPLSASGSAPGPASNSHSQSVEHKAFFLHDLLTRIVIPEAHRVRPNRRWEFRFRMLRLLGHGLALLVFGWLALAFTTSWRNNLAYLETVQARTAELRGKVMQLLAEPTRANVPAVLDSARLVPLNPALGEGSPPASFAYGLFVAEPVMAASAEVYAGLQEHLLLPAVLQRMQVVLAAHLRELDGPGVYTTLRVYKLLHDEDRYMAEGAARDVLEWVLADIKTEQGAAALGVGDATAAHLRSLFSGARPMQSASPPNQPLIREAQAFLDSHTAGQRLYQRARTAFQKDAPPDFTLVRAVGPQAGTVFSREGGLSLESGVPGLFTYDGYHGLFEKRLASFIGRAFPDDAWVMDRSDSEQALAGQPPAGQTSSASPSAVPMVEEVRRQYLAEYVEHWDRFLGSIRAVGTARSNPSNRSAEPIEPVGGSLGFDLSVLRQFAAPDSPLIRLARTAARETTLSQALPLPLRSLEIVPATASPLSLTPAIPRNDALERSLVDQHFAALHELVTGQADGQTSDSGGPGASAAARSGLESVSVVINDFYTQLVVADTALAAGSLPPAGADAGARLLLEAGKLPAPFREVLLALARNGSNRVGEGAGTILRRQAQQQLDRLLGLLAQNVGEPCRRGIEGRYPFAASSQDAAIEDVTQLFGAGGATDEFFQRNLAMFVDTSARPWRYRSASSVMPAMLSALDNAAPVTTGPTLAGEWLKLLAQGGPDLDTFYRAQKIRELLFRENGGKKLGWKVDVTVLDLDPTITDLVIDIDGQAMRYRHGPPQPLKVEWPGPRGGSTAALTASPQISGATSVLSVDGPWALLRLLEKGRVLTSATAGRVSVEFGFDGRKALLGISAGSQPHPLNSDVLRGFHCPGNPGSPAAAT